MLQSASIGTEVSVLSRLNSLEDELTRLATITESILEEEEKKKYEFKVRSKNELELLIKSFIFRSTFNRISLFNCNTYCARHFL